MNMTLTESSTEIRNAAAHSNPRLPLPGEQGSRRTRRRELQNFACILDQLIPLRNASHADVTTYFVETPMRYSECFATLADGSKTCFVNRRQFVGSRSNGFDQSLLFKSLGMLVEVRAGRRDQQTTGGAQSVAIRLSGVPAQAGTGIRARQYVAIDGSLIDH